MTGRALAASVAKEGRALLPLWAGCMAILVGAEVLGAPILRRYLLVVYGFGVIALGAHALGQEYAHRTLPMVMALPVPRRQILAAKLAVTAAMVLAVSVIVWITMADTPALQRTGAERVLLLVGLAAVTIAPALTAASHSTVAGVVFTVATAAIVWLAGDMVGAWRYGSGNAATVDAFRLRVFWPTMFTLCAVGAAATWWMFPRLEALQGRGRELHFPTWTSGHDRADQAGRSPVLLLLIAKELRLQQMTVVVTGLYVVALVVQIVILQLDPEAWTQWLMPVAVFHAIAVAGLAGALASAEERQLGTWQAQQLLPVAAWYQWLVKAGVGFALAFALGIGVTWAFSFPLPALWDGVTPLRMAAGLVLLLSFALYVSSASRSGVRAVVGTVLALFVAAVIYFPVSLALSQAARQVAASWGLPDVPRYVSPAGQGLAMLVLAPAVLLTLGHRNHRSDGLGVRTVVHQAAGLALLWLVLGLVAFIRGL